MARRLPQQHTADPAAAIRAPGPLDIDQAVASGTHPLRAALDAVKRHSAVIAAYANPRDDRDLALANASGQLVARTVYTWHANRPADSCQSTSDEPAPF